MCFAGRLDKFFAGGIELAVGVRRSRMLKIRVIQTLMITLQAALTRQVSMARALSNFPES
jgi:hypothetical protein